MRALLVSAVALLGAAPAFAQAEVHLTPGHPDLTPVDVADEVLAVRMDGPTGRVLGTIVRTATPNSDGTVTVVTEADAPRAGYVSQDSARYGAGFAPLFATQEGPGGSGTATYDGRNVSGTFVRGERAALPFDIDLPEAAFDGDAVPLVARSLPLREGYTAVMATFSPLNRLRETTLTVVGEEDVTLADGSTASAWVVEEDAPGNRDRRFYVDGETRDLLQITVAPNTETLLVFTPTTEEALAAEAGPPAVTVRPGDAALRTAALRGYTESYAYKLLQPVQQDLGTATRALSIDTGAGTATLITTLDTGNQSSRDSLVARWPSMEPVSRTLTSNGTTTTITFANGVARRSQGEETKETPFGAPVFDTGWLQEIVRALPLADGYRAALEGIGPAGDPLPITVTVMGSEEQASGRAWTVEAVPDAGAAMTFTVDDDTREVLTMQLAPQIGVLLEMTPGAVETASE